jgi:hypothetical protein
LIQKIRTLGDKNLSINTIEEQQVMRTKLSRLLAVWMLLVSAALADSSVTYQGQLNYSGTNYTGEVDLEFALYDEPSDGILLAPVVSSPAHSVVNGLFQADLDFGPDAFDGNVRWLQISVDQVPLAPRQALRPAPIALYALNAGAGGDPSPWLESSDNIYYSNGHVGIGIDSPQAPLHVVSSAAENAVILPGLIILNSLATPSLLGGSKFNTVEQGVSGAVISGGGSHDVQHEANAVEDDFGTVGGGFANRVSGNAGTISGGYGNWVSTLAGNVSGGRDNQVSGFYGTVGGGHANQVLSSTGTVGGGFENQVVSGSYATISGGFKNQVFGDTGVIGGGYGNSTEGASATVSGGYNNHAIGDFSTIGGGDSNEASGSRATVAGGYQNEASGHRSMVPGGLFNLAAGNYSFAAGRQAQAMHHGTFAWADDPGTVSIPWTSTAPNQFLIRASGGFGFNRAPQDKFEIFSGLDQQNTDYSFGTGALRVSIGDGSGGVATKFRVLGNGGVAIGSAFNSSGVPSNGLRVSGQAHFNSRVTLFDGLSTTLFNGGDPVCAQAPDVNGISRLSSCASSARFKRDVEDLANAAELIMQLRPVQFHWIDGGTSDVGLIAEEVAAIDSRLVTYNAAGEIQGVKYGYLTAVLAAAFQEQQVAFELQLQERDVLISALYEVIAEQHRLINQRMAKLELAMESHPGIASE